MCGIIGYIGGNNAVPAIIDGLKKLEYRGYDSSGIAINIDDKLVIEKKEGRIINLENSLDVNLYSNIGIGHTRWATHGEPSEVNAHPHFSTDKSIAVIHNGIIENYLEIKKWLESENVRFVSETDTEVIAHLISYNYNGDLEEAVTESLKRLRGAYALGVISKDEPDKIIAVRKDSPLVIGLGEGENFIASDVPAILKNTKNVVYLDNDDMAILTKDEVVIYNGNGDRVEKDIETIEWDMEAAEKGGYPHFTIKEINEQPDGIQKVIDRRINDSGKIVLDGINLTKKDIEKLSRIYIVACGTSYHAGLVGKYVIEKFTKLPVQVEIGSEFRYKDPLIDENTLIITVSQSGETLDTLQSLRIAKEQGARIMSIVNVVGSSIARESDDVFYTWAGPEIGVASTKAFTTQMLTFYLIALFMADEINTIEKEKYNEIVNEIKKIPNSIQNILNDNEKIYEIAKKQFNNEKIFFIGRGLDVEISYEASLKLKEISYINSQAIAAGELKHGTIALIEKETLVVAIATQDRLYEKMLSNIKEVKARKGSILSIAKIHNKEIDDISDYRISIPDTLDILTPLLSIVPMQLFAYYMSVLRGNDVDKPRNLAKSVTVE
ncbi:glutamine--fructose-6-phosphate transaminase (isomerizing) [Clostridiaceae bacterium HSG29]|nr:glutamine--fructose-6-phosphate transaminase (isomerizing) [Clostridiaceae bacterium HSG29]